MLLLLYSMSHSLPYFSYELDPRAWPIFELVRVFMPTPQVVSPKRDEPKFTALQKLFLSKLLVADFGISREFQ